MKVNRLPLDSERDMILARIVDEGRRELIARAVRQSGFVRNSELSSRFGVSTVTIRQDIDALSARGLVQKTYGGAVFNPESSLDSSFDQRSLSQSWTGSRMTSISALSQRDTSASPSQRTPRDRIACLGQRYDA